MGKTDSRQANKRLTAALAEVMSACNDERGRQQAEAPGKKGIVRSRGRRPEQRTHLPYHGGWVGGGEMLSAVDQLSETVYTLTQGALWTPPTSHSESMGLRLVQERD